MAILGTIALAVLIIYKFLVISGIARNIDRKNAAKKRQKKIQAVITAREVGLNGNRKA
jgi:hypothetical protein